MYGCRRASRSACAIDLNLKFEGFTCVSYLASTPTSTFLSSNQTNCRSKLSVPEIPCVQSRDLSRGTIWQEGSRTDDAVPVVSWKARLGSELGLYLDVAVCKICTVEEGIHITALYLQS